jgi:hypothetical protein
MPLSQTQTNTVYDWAMMTIPDNTTLYIGPGVTIQGPTFSQSTSRAIFTNSNMFSNSVSVTGSSYVNGTGDLTPSYLITFTTATAHGYQPGQYVMIKGDTSSYGYNKTWLVYSVTATTFTVLEYYGTVGHSTTPGTLSGTVIAYLANSNIHLICDGIISNQQNTNNPSWMASNWSGYTRTAILWNKFGRIQQEANFVNTACCTAMANGDWFICNRNSLINGALGFQIEGPFKKATLQNLYGEGSEEEVIVKTNESNSGYHFNDQNGTSNSTGNVEDVTIDGLVTMHNAIRAVCLLVGNGFTLGRFSLRNLHKKFAGAATVYIQGCTSQTGNIGECDIQDINIVPVPGTLGVFIDPVINASININRLRMNQWQVKGGNGCSGYYNTQNAGMLYVGPSSSACTINEIELNNSYVEHDTTQATAAMNSISLAQAGWTIGDIICSNADFVGTGATQTMNGVQTTGTITACKFIQVNNCTVTNGNANGSIVSNSLSGLTIEQIGSRSFVTGGGNTGMVNSSVSCTIRSINCDDLGNNTPITSHGGSGAQTFNLYLSNCKTGSYMATGWTASQPVTVNVYSGGGNTGTPPRTNVSGNTYNFIGNCADMGVDITTIARTTGTIIKNTAAAAGTIVQNNLVVSDATGAANSWHQMTVPTNVY